MEYMYIYYGSEWKCFLHLLVLKKNLYVRKLVFFQVLYDIVLYHIDYTINYLVLQQGAQEIREFPSWPLELTIIIIIVN